MQRQLAIQDLCAGLDRGTLLRADFADRCSALVASMIGCSRASLWLLLEAESGPLVQPITRATAAPAWGLALDAPCDRFVGSLRNEGAIVAHDARAHAATAGWFDSAAPASPVQSMLAVPFSVNGELHGAFVCAELDRTIRWSAHQVAALRRLGAGITPALARATSFAMSARLADLPPPRWTKTPIATVALTRSVVVRGEPAGLRDAPVAGA